ncbi:MAG: hypothetical protein PVH19_15330, partial [Planctomycetia bacterium]
MVLLLMEVGASAAITIQFDYTYDVDDPENGKTAFFPQGSEARETLEWVGEFYGSLLNDDFTAITSTFKNNYTIFFYAPNEDPTALVSISEYDVPADTIIIYVGANDISGGVLAWGGPGAYSTGSSPNPTWRTNAITRGEGTIDQVRNPDDETETAVEIAIWGGMISINENVNWHTDHSTLPASGKADLASTLLHEFGHVLGLGIWDSWDNLIDENGLFTGEAATAANGGVSVPVEANGAHWESGATSSTIFGTTVSQKAIMEPSITYGQSALTSTLDVAALDDVGWDINPIDTWIGAADTNFSAVENWSTNEVPVERDSIRFDQSGGYLVSMDEEVSLQQVSVEAGQVTWLLNGHTVTADRFWVTGGGTSFCLEEGTLQVDMRATAAWDSQFTVGMLGRLELNRSTFKGNLTVEAWGELAGSGVIAGCLYHQAEGVVSPGGNGPVGRFEIENGYEQEGNAILEIDLLSLTEYDFLTIDGPATLSGSLIVHVEPGLSLHAFDEFVILEASDLTGQFDAILGDLL